MAGDLGPLPAFADLGERRFGVGEGDLVQPAASGGQRANSGPARQRRPGLAAVVAAGQIDVPLGRQLVHRHPDPQVAQIALVADPRRRRGAGRRQRATQESSLGKRGPSLRLPSDRVASTAPFSLPVSSHRNIASLQSRQPWGGRTCSRATASLVTIVLLAGRAHLSGRLAPRRRPIPAGALREGQLRRLPQVAWRRRRRLWRRGAVAARDHARARDLIEVIRCGRPATRMPYHDRGAYQGPSAMAA